MSSHRAHSTASADHQHQSVRGLAVAAVHLPPDAALGFVRRVAAMTHAGHLTKAEAATVLGGVSYADRADAATFESEIRALLGSRPRAIVAAA